MEDSVDDRLQAIIDNAEIMMEQIYMHVANGGVLTELCKMWKVPYAKVMNWIRTDKDRNEKYADALLDRNDWIRESLIGELRKLSLVDIREMFNDDGSVKEPSQWPEHISVAVKGFDIIDKVDKEGHVTSRTYKVQFWSKEKSIELLGKNLSMFVEQIKHSGTVTLEDIVAGSWEDV